MSRRHVLGLLVIIAAVTFLLNDRPPLPATDTDARIAFYQARTGGRGTYPAYARLGMAYLTKARETADPAYLAKAEENLKASMAFQRNFEALRALAFLAMEKHEFGAALEYATEAQATVPSDWEAKGILSDAYWALGDRSRAVKLVQEMLASGRNFAALSRLSVIRFAEGDTAGAIESMRSACIQADKESRPLDNRAWCYTRLGTYLAARGDTAAAEEACRRAVAYIPGYPYALRELETLQASRMSGTERNSAAAKPN